MIRHPVLPSLLFLTGCGFMAAAGVIVLAGVIESLADMVLDEDGPGEPSALPDAPTDGDMARAAVPALRAPLARVQGETSEHADAFVRHWRRDGGP